MYLVLLISRPEEFSKEVTKEHKLPHEFEYLISMAIRKQIKEYVFSSIHNFADSYLKTKNYIFNTDSQSQNKSQFITTNGSSRRTNLNSENRYKGANKDKNEYQFPTSIIKKPKEIDLEDDKDLMYITSFIFENKMEKELGPLHNLRYTTREAKDHKPQVLKNHSKKKKKMNEIATTAVNSLINNKILYSDMNKIVISKQCLVMAKNYDIITIDKNKIEKYL